MKRLMDVILTGWTSRRAANLGTAILALANAVISYDALAAAARSAGLPWVLSWLFPLATDGIIAVATPAQLYLRKRNAPRWARAQIGLLLYAAIIFSVVGNASRAARVWAGGDAWGVPLPTWSAVWLALPPLAYAGALHVLGLVHRYPVPTAEREPTAEGTRSAEVLALRTELAEARGEIAAAMRALDAANKPTAPDGGPVETHEKRERNRADLGARTAQHDGRQRALKTAARRAPNGARRDEMRALLSSPDGRELTGDQLGERLGIDPGYARRLRATVLSAEPSALAGVNAREEAEA